MSSPRKPKYWTKQSIKVAPFDSQYERGDEVFRGPTICLFKCQKRGLPDDWIAKVINKRTNRRLFRTADIAIALGIQHKNLAYLRDVFESPTELTIVQEILTGGELFHRIPSIEFYTEAVIAEYMLQILTGLAYLHEVGLAHRNLKPENLLLATDERNAAVKICDYGISSMMETDVNVGRVWANPYYTAPEVLKGNVCGKEADVWAVGVILYIMLCGFAPFNDENPSDLYKKIMKGSFNFYDSPRDIISEDAKDLVGKMLRPKPSDRPTAHKLTKAMWVNCICIRSDTALLDVKEKLEEFNSRRYH